MATEDVFIDITGEITSLEMLTDLMDAAVNDVAGIDWQGEPDGSDIMEAVVVAAREGKPLTFFQSDTSRPFVELTAFCHASGLTYRKTAGVSGDEGYNSLSVWMEGFEKEKRFDLDGTGKPSISLDELKRAIERGMDAVEVLVRNREFVSRGFDDLKLVIEPALIENWQAKGMKVA